MPCPPCQYRTREVGSAGLCNCAARIGAADRRNRAALFDLARADPDIARQQRANPRDGG